MAGADTDGFRQGVAAERECVLCLSAARTVRFGCGHSTLCDACLPTFLAEAGPRALCPHCRAPVVST